MCIRDRVKEQPTVGVNETAPAVINIVPMLMADIGTRRARFREAPEICVAMDETILRHWVDRISGEELANTYLKKFNHSGIAFIIAMGAHGARGQHRGPGQERAR